MHIVCELLAIKSLNINLHGGEHNITIIKNEYNKSEFNKLNIDYYLKIMKENVKNNPFNLFYHENDKIYIESEFEYEQENDDILKKLNYELKNKF